MKIKYQAPKGQRIKNQSFSLELDRDMQDWICWAYHPETNEWRNTLVDASWKTGETYATTFCQCYSLKAAIRRIKQWNFPKGTKFVLRGWEGNDIYIIV